MSRLTLTGSLRSDARYWHDGRGGVVLSVVIDQPAGCPSIHAGWTLGEGNAAFHSAHRAAMRMRRGVQVRVHAEAISINHARPLDLECLGVTLVEQLDLPQHHTERAEASR